MDEEEYEALTEEEKIAFDREVQQALRERKKRWDSRAGLSRSTAPWRLTGVVLQGGVNSRGRPRQMTC